MAGRNMREVDTETPVVWPAWCYSGDASVDISESSPASHATVGVNMLQQIHHQQRQQQAAVVAAAAAAAAATSMVRNKGKRKTATLHGMHHDADHRPHMQHDHHINVRLDKIITDQMRSLSEVKGSFCDVTTGLGGLLYGKDSTANGNGADNATATSGILNFTKAHRDDERDGNDRTSPIDTLSRIKTERLSPVAQMSQNGTIPMNGSQILASKPNGSQSPTPFAATQSPSQQRHRTLSMFPNQQQNHSTDNQHQSGVDPQQPRNYSDFIRSLAAKYNNANPNETVCRSIVDKTQHFDSERLVGNVPIATTVTSKHITKESPSMSEMRRLSFSPPQASNQSSIISSVFSGIQFPTDVFPPMIDMSSTQALLTLVRAAKQADIQDLLKVSPCFKRNLHLHCSPPSATFQKCTLPATSKNHQQSNHRIQRTTVFPHAKSTSPPVDALEPASSMIVDSDEPPSVARSAVSCPLDLSSVGGKRLKLASPIPGRQSCAGSPQIVVSTTMTRTSSTPVPIATSMMSERRHQGVRCHEQNDEISTWSVGQVCDFVGSIDICAEYKEIFREQQIDGSALPLLTEDHLMHSLGMKLGPALKLRSVLTKRLCSPCMCVGCSSGQLKSENEPLQPTIIPKIEAQLDSLSPKSTPLLVLTDSS